MSAISRAAVASFAERRFGRLLVVVLLVGLALRVAVFLDLRATDPDFLSPPLDSRVFLQWAAEIAGGNVLGDRPFFLNPLYPYFLAPIVGISGASQLLVIRIVQWILGLAAAALVAGATKRAVGPAAGLLAGLLTAAWPLLLFYEQAVMIVSLAVFLNALALFLVLRISEKPTPGSALLAGLPLGLSVLARPNVALFALMLPLWLVTLSPRERRWRFVAIRTLALFAGVAAAVLPVTLRNWIVGRDLVIATSSMGVNLWQSNNPEARRTGRMTSRELRSNPRLVESDSITVAEQATGRTLKPSEVSGYWARRALDTVLETPGRSAVFLARKLLYFLSGDEPPSSHHFAAQRQETKVLRWIPLSFGLLAPLAILGAFLALGCPRACLPFALLFAAYGVGLTIFFPLAHYRAPVLPAAIPLAVLALSRLLRPELWKGRRLLVTAPLVLAAAGIPLVSTAARAAGIEALAPYPDERVIFWFNRGLSLLERREGDAAVRAFEQARREDPTSWLPDQGMALVARARGDLELEALHVERLRERRGDVPEVLYMLGRNLFERGREEEGLRLSEAAAERDPRDPNVQENLGNLYIALGRPGDALGRFEAAERHGRPLPRNLAMQVLCLRLTGRSEEARERARRGLAEFPDAGPLHFEMAFLLVEDGAPSEAIREQVRAGAAAGWAVPEPLRRYLD